MNFSWDPELEQFKQQVRRFAQQQSADLPPTTGEGEDTSTNEHLRAIKQDMDDRGWARQAWPVEYGGGGKSPWYQYVLVEELSYYGIPMTDISIGSVLPAIMNHGTEEQKKKYVPAILDGKVTFAIGYSEPNAGTDLASLETRATRDGDDWVINGQKLWTSGAHMSTHLWLAARTDPNAPKHRGISMFILPLNTPGISVRPIFTMGGGRTNETFYEDVRVPGDSLIGEEGRGWYTVANALDHERVTIAPLGGLVCLYDQLIDYLKKEKPELLKDRAVGLRLAELKLDLHVQRALKLKNAAIIAAGGTPTMEASMTKVWSSELKYRLNSMAMDLLGRYGAQSRESGDVAPVDGIFDSGYRNSPVTRFGGGTNEVQRNIIAQRGLGLPR